MRDADDVFRSKDLINGSTVDETILWQHGTVQALNFAPHFERRRIESGLFRREALAYYESEFAVPALQAELRRVRKHCDNNTVRFDVLDVARTSMMQLSAALVGLDGVDNHESSEHLHGLMLRIAGGYLLPWLDFGLEERRVVMSDALLARSEFKASYFEPSIKRRRESLRIGEAPPARLDLLTVLLMHESADWDSELILREADLFVLGSSGALAGTISFTLYELERWLIDHPEDEDNLTDLAFLTNAVWETLRIHPTVPFLIRRAVRATHVAGKSVKEGEYIKIDVGAANKDPAFFGPSAEVFDLWRQKDKARPYGVTFGGGPHVCLGKAMAAGPTFGQADEDSNVGVIVRQVQELYRNGVRVDLSTPPDRVPGVTIRLANLWCTMPTGSQRT